MDAKTEAFRKLEEVVEILRGPGGCPWDREQTLSDMSRYLLEEACEAVDAIQESGGRATPDVEEELGDVLLNVLLASRIAEEDGSFGIAEVADGIREKLVRRHPHVFGDAAGEKSPVRSSSDVLTRWNAIKETEKASGTRPRSRLAGVPRSLPPLERAHELGRKAARAGFDWPGPEGALEKVEEEIGEVKAALAAGGNREGIEEELGDLLFAAANLCRKLDVRPSEALRKTLAKFCARFAAIEERFPEMEKASLEEMEAVWNAAKPGSARESGPHGGKDR
jgi:MazG family protein